MIKHCARHAQIQRAKVHGSPAQRRVIGVIECEGFGNEPRSAPGREGCGEGARPALRDTGYVIDRNVVCGGRAQRFEVGTVAGRVGYRQAVGSQNRAGVTDNHVPEIQGSAGQGCTGVVVDIDRDRAGHHRVRCIDSGEGEGSRLGGADLQAVVEKAVDRGTGTGGDSSH